MQSASSEHDIQSMILRQSIKAGQENMEKSGVAESYLHKWLAGESGLKFEQFCRMINALNIHLETSVNAEADRDAEAKISVQADYFDALKVLARKSLENTNS